MELNTNNIYRPKIRYQYTQTLSNIFNILKEGILSSKCYQRDVHDSGKLILFKQHLYTINYFINKLQIIKNLQYLTDKIVLQKSGLIRSPHKLSVCHERISSFANAPFHVFQKLVSIEAYNTLILILLPSINMMSKQKDLHLQIEIAVFHL